MMFAMRRAFCFLYILFKWSIYFPLDSQQSSTTNLVSRREVDVSVAQYQVTRDLVSQHPSCVPLRLKFYPGQAGNCLSVMCPLCSHRGCFTVLACWASNTTSAG